MTITLSQADYWDLFEAAEPIPTPPSSNPAEESWVVYPKRLGQGYQRWISLRPGLELMVAEYELLDDVQVLMPERPHPLEYMFELPAGKGAKSTYGLWGSGLAPQEQWGSFAGGASVMVSVHLEPDLFREWIGGAAQAIPAAVQPLLRSQHQPYYERTGEPTAAMRMVLQQLLHCPYQGLTWRLYLESKVWELMALLLEDMQAQPTGPRASSRLRSEDVERIHYAGKLLVRRLDNPPSLIELARAVGINDHKLKVGFRQVYGTTVFGYLHEQRLVRSHQLLATGEVSVAEAAQGVGFASRGHFAAAFRRRFGVNPSAYVRQRAN
ncbi:MAG TPA: AraC family transcriptional regulator [Trichocoleus sp.]